MEDVNFSLPEVQEERKLPIPQVEYDEVVLSPDCSYKVFFDGEKASRLLNSLDLSDDEIRSLKVKLVDKAIVTSNGRDANGVFSKDSISISVGGMNDFLLRGLDATDEIIATNNIPKSQEAEARAQLTASMSAYVQQEIDGIFNHEVGHYVSEIESKRNIAAAVTNRDFKQAAILIGNRVNMIFLPHTAPEKVREEAFANSVKDKINQAGKWGNIVQLKPKI